MKKFQIGCQTITFQEGQKDRLGEVFGEIAGAGYAGLEIGFRHIRETPPLQLSRLLADHNLQLIATHIGGNLHSSDQAASERSLIEEVIDYLSGLDCNLVIYSGSPQMDLEQDIAMLKSAAAMCHEQGIQLAYHNHYWEFDDGERIMNALIAEPGARWSFCPDIGWVVQGGGDPVQLLSRVKDRLALVHFKDFAPEGSENDFIELGAGVIPLRDVAAWMRENLENLWVVAEQDVAESSPEEAVRKNAIFLKELFL